VLVDGTSLLVGATGGVRLLVAEHNLPRIGEVIAVLKRGEYDDESAKASDEPLGCRSSAASSARRGR
jgi:hypothetical protein